LVDLGSLVVTPWFETYVGFVRREG
jgi:hypothetical protein